MPELSSLQTSSPGTVFWPFQCPLQQDSGALMLRMPPSGRCALPQMLPTGLQALPWSQRPVVMLPASAPRHSTEPLGLVPPPQQLWSSVHHVPVRRQPSAGWHTVTPEPGSMQMREQQLLPSLQSSPAWSQPPAPLPLMEAHRPTPPPVAVQAWPQHSSLLRQMSPTGWQEYALEQKPLWQLVEQQSVPVEQVWPSTLQLPPGSVAQTPASQVPVQQSFPEAQAWPTSVQTLLEQVPLTQLLRQQSVSVLQESPLAAQKLGAPHVVPSQTPLQQGTPEAHAAPVVRQAAVPPPSVPPSVPTFPGPFPGLLTEPLQLHAPSVRRAPMAHRTRKGLEICIDEVL